MGRVGAAPEVGATSGGARVATFRLATDRPARRGEVAKTDWHTVVAWDRLVALVEREVRRGDRVYVEGWIETRETTGRKGRRTVTEIIALAVIPLGGRVESWSPAEQDPGRSGATPFARRPPDPDVEEDLPF
jgi:single-strand DNA-binding protein